MNKTIFFKTEKKKLLKQFSFCINQTGIIIRFLNSPENIIEEYKTVRIRIINRKFMNLVG